jgi:hypothetical protein
MRLSVFRANVLRREERNPVRCTRSVLTRNATTRSAHTKDAAVRYTRSEATRSVHAATVAVVKLFLYI